MLSDAEFSHRLDAALAPMSKIFQHAIPFKNRLVELGGSLTESPTFSQSLMDRDLSLHTTARLRDGQKNTETQVTEETLRRIAKAECESRVEVLQQWQDRAAQGRCMGDQCLSVLNNLSSCLGSMHDVTRAVQEQSNLLSSNASALMVRKRKLEMVQEELERVIKHFTRIEVLTREAEGATLSATSASYPGMLQEMEEEMHFLSRNSQFLSAKTYTTKLAEAQQRVFQCLKDAIVLSIQAAKTETLNAEVYRSAFYQQQQSVSNDGVEMENNFTGTSTMPLPVFGAEENTEIQKTMSETLKHINDIFCKKLGEKASLRRMMESCRSERIQEDEINDNEVFYTYCEVRVVIIGPLLQNWLEVCCVSHSTTGMLPQLVNRLIFLMKIALACEKDVFDDVWLREDYSTYVFLQLIPGLSNELYHVFRSQLLQVDELDELSQTIEEIHHANTKQDEIAEFSELLTKMIQDTQERLIFRTSVFLRQSIVRCAPSKELVQEFLNGGAAVNDSFIPALSNCVALLRLLYPSLEFSVFSVFAEEAIHCALIQIHELARIIGQQRCDYSVIKGLMCQLRHLLHLRMELSRIDENITVVEKFIDLSKITQRRFEIVQSSRESKKDVETEIKVCCERIVQLLFLEVSAPLSGVARKETEDIQDAVLAAEQKWTTQKNLLGAFISDASTREVLLCPVRARLDELLRETACIQQKVDLKTVEGIPSSDAAVPSVTLLFPKN